MNKILSITAVLLFFLVDFVHSEEYTSLESLLNKAKKQNPEIIAIENKYRSLRAKINEEKSWEYPLVGVEFSKTETMFSVNQMLSFPGKLSLKGDIAVSESKATEQMLISKIRDISAEVKKSYWLYWFLEKQIEIYRENIQIMRRFLNTAKTQYAVGKVTQTDVLKSSIELSEMEAMITMIEQEKNMVIFELNKLVNEPPTTTIGKPVKPQLPERELSYAEIEEIALKNNPELRAKEFDYKKSDYVLKLAKLQWYPDLMAGVKFGEMTTPIYMLESSIPLYFGRQKALTESSEKEKEVYLWEVAAVKSELRKNIGELIVKYQTHLKLQNIYKESIIPLSEQSLKITEAGYVAGKNDFLDFLDSQKNYLDHKINYYRHIFESGVILAEIEKISGIDIK